MRDHEHSTIEYFTEALLEVYMSEELKNIARLTGSRVPARKADLAVHIARFLAGEGLREAYDSLNEIERAAVAEVVHSDADVLDEERFIAKYGSHPAGHSEGRYFPRGHFTLFDMFLLGRRRIMAREIKMRLKQFVPPPSAVTLRTIETPSQLDESRRRSRGTAGEKAEPVTVAVHVHPSEQRAQHELLAVLRLVDGRKVSVSSKTLRPSKVAMAAISGVLDGEDFYTNDLPSGKYYDPNPGPIRAFAWPMILQAAGLVRLSGNRLALTEEGRTALSAPAGEVMRDVWNRWIYAMEVDELSRIESVKGQTGKGGRSLTLAVDRREAIRSALAACPANEWIELAEFDRFMRASGMEAPVSKDPWGLYIGQPEYGSLGYAGGVEVLDQAYLKTVLLEYAATMGLVDVALVPPADARRGADDLWGMDDLPYFSRYDGLTAIRITALGAYCLGISETYIPAAPVAERYLRVLANKEIVATGAEISKADRLALDQYFEPATDLVWRIEREKLLSLVENNGTIEQVSEFLQTRSETPVPETVTQLFADIGERSGLLHDVGTARLVECDDEALALLIANDTYTRRHCMRAGSRHVVVPMESESAFKRGLKKLGFVVR